MGSVWSLQFVVLIRSFLAQVEERIEEFFADAPPTHILVKNWNEMLESQMPVRSDQQIEAQILAVLIYSPGPEIYVVGEAHVLQLPPLLLLLTFCSD